MSHEQSNTTTIDAAELADLFALSGVEQIVENANPSPLNKTPDPVGAALDTSLEEEEEEAPGGETEEQKTAREAKIAEAEEAKRKAAAGSGSGAGTAEEEEEIDITNEGVKQTIKKSEPLAFLDHLIKKEELLLFEGTKPLSEYTNKEKVELIRANIARAKEEEAAKAPAELYARLPEPMKYALEYIENGGTNLQALFKSLGEAGEVAEIDVKTPEGQEQIVRQWMLTTDAGTLEDIEEEITSLKDLPGALEKRAVSVKPKLEAKKQELVEKQVRDAEELSKKREAATIAYRDSILTTLQAPNLGGLKLKPTEKSFLFNEMTQLKHQLKTGQQTNILGALLEKHQRTEPNPALIMKAVLLLNDEARFMELVKESLNTEIVGNLAQNLKTASAKDKGASAPASGTPAKKNEPSKTIKKANLFSWG